MDIDTVGKERWGVTQGDRVRLMPVDFGELSTPESFGVVVGFQDMGGLFGVCVLIRNEDSGVVLAHAYRDFHKID